MDLSELQTPCCIVDLARVRGNIESLHKQLERFDAGLRPHGKTVKNIDLIRPALKNQPGGITVSTLREADYYFSNGIRDITYAVGIDPSKLPVVAKLIQRGAEIRVILDTREQLEAVIRAGKEYSIEFPFLIEIDCDGDRAGMSPGDPLMIELGRMAEKTGRAALEGVLTHAGGSYHSDSAEGIRAVAEMERRAAVQAAEMLRQAGFNCPVVSVGSTPTASMARNLDGVTEIRAGVFIFQDLMMAGLGVCSPEEIALSVLTSVTGYQKSKGWLITDAGWMALSSAPPGRGGSGFGIACDIEGNRLDDFSVSSTSQEHGIVSSESGMAPDYGRFGIGSRLRILPNHACATGAMHNFYFTVDGGMEVTGRLERANGWY